MSSLIFKSVKRALAINVPLGAFVGALFALTGGNFSAGYVVISFAIAFAFSFLLGIPSTIAFLVLAPRTRHRGIVAQAVIILGALIPITLIGCFVLGRAFVALHLWTIDSFWIRFFHDVRFALATIATTGIGIIAYDRIDERLEHTRDVLRDREIDQARAETKALEARLASLESRVRPHFLFNSLNAALALIPTDPARAEIVLERVSTLLRFSLDVDPTGLISLQDEIRLVRDYLEIEHVRLQDRLRYEIDVPEKLLSFAVPPFSIQTLVENSVKYAITPRREGGVVQVSATEEGEQLRLVVMDNGPGIEADAAAHSQRGLFNLRERLASVFGPKGRLEIATDIPGAKVTLWMPNQGRTA